MLRRFAEAIDRRPDTGRRRRAILHIAAADFASQLRPRRGASGATGVGGWDLCNLAEPAFWTMLLLSRRRKRFAMTLLGQVHQDRDAVEPYVREKRAAQEILDATGLDPDSLTGFVSTAAARFLPPGATGSPLIPSEQAHAILAAALLRGAMIGELAPEKAPPTWSKLHPEQSLSEAEGHAEILFTSWQKQRRSQGRRLI